MILAQEYMVMGEVEGKSKENAHHERANGDCYQQVIRAVINGIRVHSLLQATPSFLWHLKPLNELPPRSLENVAWQRAPHAAFL